MTKDRFAALAALKESAALEPEPERESRPAPQLPGRELKALGARVPLEITREFAQAKLDAESAARLRRVTTEHGLEALVRLLRDPEIRAAWHRELQKIADEN